MPSRATPSAKRYAQAIFQMASEQGRSEQWLGTLETISDALTDPQLVAFIDSPEVGIQNKMTMVHELISRTGAEATVQSFFSLLVTKRLGGSFPAIVDEYKRLLDIQRGIVRAQVTTAVLLVDDLKSAIVSKLSEIVNQQVVATFKVDPTLLGGMKVRVGDRLLDGSTKAKLMDLKRSLAEAAL